MVTPSQPSVPPPGRRVLFGLVVLLLVGCAPGYTVPEAPSPDQIPALETRVAENPGDVAAHVALGAAYREDGRLPQARSTLTRAVELEPEYAPGVLFLGLTLEELEEWDEAAERYRALLDSGAGSSDLRAELERRLPLIERRRLQAAVRTSLAREAELADEAPEPNTVAVFPFHFVGEDPDYAPLGRAMAEMLVTDLGRVGRVTVVERLRVQVLLDEMALAEEGRVDPATAVRSGRILGAGRVVQGQLDGDADRLGLRAAVVTSPMDDLADDLPELTDDDALERFYELQARLALGVHRALGIQLTVAEEEMLADRPTQNLQAILAWGRGLEAEDRGDFALAVEHYQSAVDFDGGFDAPREGADRAGGLADSEQVSTTDLSGRAWEEVSVDATAESPGAGPADPFEGLDALVPTSIERDAAVELLGSEGVSGGISRTLIEIIIRRP
jgi:TolB-like protein